MQRTLLSELQQGVSAVSSTTKKKENIMQSVIGILILIADIYAIIKIIQSSADTVKKILWILGVLVFPVLGLIVWYLAGPGSKTD
ncbi:PLD nuclease N-terminal domain-containing protein [Methylobacillus sp. Pita2]|uniref:PLD nuclease N-terminal domain-containing protein n=1 Tax=Methylobacillus TaxID=404 RepID=UPI0028689170|nr:PLD nuclease N-terminal domain-containing protein [Methylobacillus flagellatus]